MIVVAGEVLVDLVVNADGRVDAPVEVPAEVD